MINEFKNIKTIKPIFSTLDGSPHFLLSSSWIKWKVWNNFKWFYSIHTTDVFAIDWRTFCFKRSSIICEIAIQQQTSGSCFIAIAVAPYVQNTHIFKHITNSFQETNAPRFCLHFSEKNSDDNQNNYVSSKCEIVALIVLTHKYRTPFNGNPTNGGTLKKTRKNALPLAALKVWLFGNISLACQYL